MIKQWKDENIIEIIKKKGFFSVSKYSYKDEKLRRMLRRLRDKGIVERFSNPEWKMKEILLYKLVDRDDNTVVS